MIVVRHRGRNPKVVVLQVLVLWDDPDFDIREVLMTGKRVAALQMMNTLEPSSRDHIESIAIKLSLVRNLSKSVRIRCDVVGLVALCPR
jgi:hypothetical protein